MYVIDKDSCASCGTCIDTCPRDSIECVEGVYQIIQKDCLSCGSCADVCPMGAIVKE